jgi:hypothetical protein
MERTDYRCVWRQGDMAPDNKLRLRLDGDGDIHVIVEGLDQWTGKPSSVSVEFTTIGNGGGRSPKVFAALSNLFLAMQEEPPL